jgi:hypothetical protein
MSQTQRRDSVIQTGCGEVDLSRPAFLTGRRKERKSVMKRDGGSKLNLAGTKSDETGSKLSPLKSAGAIPNKRGVE